MQLINEQQKQRVEAKLIGVICERCNCTLDTFAVECTADLADLCPGFQAIEKALESDHED